MDKTKYHDMLDHDLLITVAVQMDDIRAEISNHRKDIVRMKLALIALALGGGATAVKIVSMVLGS